MAESMTTKETGAPARSARKVRLGVVVSDAHPRYGKMVTRSTKVKAHDEQNDAKTGDTVRIMETRPLSKDKRWRVVEIVDRAR